jgi:hypothetical protein
MFTCFFFLFIDVKSQAVNHHSDLKSNFWHVTYFGLLEYMIPRNKYNQILSTDECTLKSLIVITDNKCVNLDVDKNSWGKRRTVMLSFVL